MRIRMETFRRMNLFIATFLGCTLFFYLFLNGGAYWRILRYNIFLRSPFASDELKRGDILSVKTASPSYEKATGGTYRLYIPKISVDVPIAVSDDASKKGILASLEEGVGLYPGSVDPGAKGRVIMLGHSSQASWYRGEYATVFALLPELREFDKFYIVGGGKKYTYQVFAKQYLSPTDTNALLATLPTFSEANLITCYPIGSASKRTIIQAQLMNAENI